MPAPEINHLWRVRLFDGPALEGENGKRITRFRSSRVGALLAYLALRVGHPVPREELYEALWPEEDLNLAVNRFRVSLSSLRKQVEPAPVQFGSVLDVSEPGRVRLRAETVWVDTVAFEIALAAGQQRDAARLISGEFLPGYYDEWAVEERIRLDALTETLGNHATRLTIHESRGVVQPVSRRGAPRLPLYLTKFFGRENELHGLQQLLAENRLVTVTGPGGMGKTRLAVETAHRMAAATVFVPLVDVNEATPIPEAILLALGYSVPPGTDPLLRVTEVIRGVGGAVLILDNADHKLDAVAAIALSLLEACPSLHILVTSRQRLSVSGEVILNLSPLDSPEHAATPERLTDFPSVALFVDRAARARPDFVLSQRHTGPVTDICRRLEGMPLAIELAAARITTQTPSQIAESLADNLVALKSSARQVPARHRSLRAAIQGSLDPLDDELRSFFFALSVFASGWTADAARAVTLNANSEELLEALVTRSLVTSCEDIERDSMRYGLLAPIRQFAAEEVGPGQGAQAAARHRDYFLSLAAQVTEDDIRSLLPLNAEMDNLTLALERAAPTLSNEYWAGLIGFLNHAYVCGNHRRAVRWIDDAMGQVSAIPDPQVRLRLRLAATLILPDIGRFDDTVNVANAMQADAETVHDSVGAVYAETIRGYVADASGKLNDAARIQHGALRRARALDSSSLLQACLSFTSGTLHSYGCVLGLESDQGRKALRDSETLARELLQIAPPYSRRAPLARLLLAAALSFQGRKHEAYEALKEAEQTATALGTKTELMYCFAYESEIELEWGHTREAALLFGAFLDLKERIGYSILRLQSFRPNWVTELSHKLQRSVGEAEYDTLVQRGRQTVSETNMAQLLSEGPW